MRTVKIAREELVTPADERVAAGRPVPPDGEGPAPLVRRDAAEVLLLVAGTMLAAGYLALFWTLDSAPFQDLPNHLTRAAAEADLLLHGGARFGRMFTLAPVISPYVAGDALLAGLVAAFGERAAGSLWTIVVAASYPLALAAYLRVTGHGRFTILVASVLGLYLTTDAFFLFGMHHFRLAVALVLVALAAWEVWLRTGSAGAFVAWTLLVLLGLLVHLSALVFDAAAAGVIGAVALGARRTRWSRILAGFLPVAVLTAWQAWSASGVPGGVAAWDASTKLVRVLFPYYRYTWKTDHVMMLVFGLACLLLVLGGRVSRAGRRSLTAALLSLLFLAMYAVMPTSRGPIHFIDERALPLAATFGLVAVLAVAEGGARLRRVVAVLAICLSAANLGLLASHLLRSNAVMRDYRALVAQLPARARVLPVASAPKDGYVRPFQHAGVFATLDAGALTPYVFAGGATPYFRYRVPPVRPLDEFWYADGLTPDAEQREAIVAGFDYVLIGVPYDPARLPIPLERVARNRSAELLRIVHR